jgi:nucleoid-associated protein YgaU
MPSDAKTDNRMHVKEQTYTLQDGDTLSGVAKYIYGNENKYMLIASANGIDDPNKVPPGWRLIIPTY